MKLLEEVNENNESDDSSQVIMFNTISDSETSDKVEIISLKHVSVEKDDQQTIQKLKEQYSQKSNKIG